MQAAVSERPSKAFNLIVLPKRMGAPAIQPPPPGPQPPWNPHWYGNLAQWIAPTITLLIGIVMVILQVHYRNVDRSAKSSDEHVNALITAQLDTKLTPITQQLASLTQTVNQLVGRFQQMDVEQKRLTSLQLNGIDAQVKTARASRTLGSNDIAQLGKSVLVFADSTDPHIFSHINPGMGYYKTAR
jgi:hypothetical protein